METSHVRVSWEMIDTSNTLHQNRTRRENGSGVKWQRHYSQHASNREDSSISACTGYSYVKKCSLCFVSIITELDPCSFAAITLTTAFNCISCTEMKMLRHIPANTLSQSQRVYCKIYTLYKHSPSHNGLASHCALTRRWGPTGRQGKHEPQPGEWNLALASQYFGLLGSTESEWEIVFTAESRKWSVMLLSESKGVSELEHDGSTGKKTAVCSLLWCSRDNKQGSFFLNVPILL